MEQVNWIENIFGKSDLELSDDEKIRKEIRVEEHYHNKQINPNIMDSYVLITNYEKWK